MRCAAALLVCVLAITAWLVPRAALAQLPDWSGVWTMVGPTVFDTATQTGKGAVTTPGVREHPPYNAEWEAIYRTHLDLRDKNRFPDTIRTAASRRAFPVSSTCPTPTSSSSGRNKCGC